MTNYFAYFDSPIGILELHANETFLLQVKFVPEKSKAEFMNAILHTTCEQLSLYFKGELKKFDLPLQFKGTDFQNYVWNGLANIDYGTTISYLQFSKRLGNVDAIRAIGTTNGKNPFSIIIPCHRVIGSNGKLVGYAGGIEKKQWLLNFEAENSGLYLL
jgi:methylated-DNA-[protein]-cysteine S-methyltransferase